MGSVTLAQTDYAAACGRPRALIFAWQSGGRVTRFQEKILDISGRVSRLHYNLPTRFGNDSRVHYVIDYQRQHQR